MNEQNQSIALEGPRFEEAIRREAYCLWEVDGCQVGRDLEYWLQAKEIIQRRLDENLGPPPTLATVVINKRTAPGDLLAAEKPESASVAASSPALATLAKGVPGEKMMAAVK